MKVPPSTQIMLGAGGSVGGVVGWIGLGFVVMGLIMGLLSEIVIKQIVQISRATVKLSNYDKRFSTGARPCAC